MTRRRRFITSIASLLLLGGLGYYVHGYITAESRLKALCGDIPPGMSADALRDFASEHGLLSPHGDGVNYLVEARTFGRYGCRVMVENQIVTESRYNFAD